MPNKELVTYYNYLKENGADVPESVSSFETTLSDSTSASKYYSYLKTNGFDVPETLDSFTTTFGLKKKDTPIIGSANGLQYPTSNTKTGASVSPLQQTGVNSQVNSITSLKAEAPTYSKEDKIASFKKAYRGNQFVSQDISDEDLQKIAESKVDKHPQLFNQLHQEVKQKEERDNRIANLSADELVAEKNAATTPDNMYEVEQSRLGKAAQYVNDIKQGINIGESDAEYLKAVAPKAYAEVVPDNQPLQQVINVNKEKAKVDEVKNAVAYDSTKKSILLQNGVLDAATINNIGNTSTANELSKKQQDEKEKAIADLDSKYPIQTYQVKTADGFDTKIQPRSKEYNDQLAAINQRYAVLNKSLADVHTTEKAKQSKNELINKTMSIQDIGLENIKLVNPNTYQQFQSGGSSSPEVKAMAEKAGIEALLATGDPQLIAQAQVAQQDFYKNHPKELADETIKRLSVEYYKSVGLNSGFNDVNGSVRVLDNLADNLPKEYKDYYINVIRKDALDNPYYAKAESWKSEPVIKLMNPSGFVNSAFDSFIGTMVSTGKALADLTPIRSKKDVANENLAGTPITEQSISDLSTQSSNTINRLVDKAKTTKLSASEINELRDAEQSKVDLPYGYVPLNKASGAVGMVGAITLQSMAMGAALGSVAGYTKAGLTALEAAPETVAIGNGAMDVAANSIAYTTKAEQIANYVDAMQKIGATSGAITMGLTVADEQYKTALRLMPNDDQAKQRAAYVGLLTTMWGSLSRIMPLEQAFKGLTPEAENELVTLAKKVTDGSIEKDAVMSSLNKIANSTKNYGLNVIENSAKITAEMTAAEGGTQVAQAVANPQQFDQQAAKDAIYHTLTNTALDMIFVNAIQGLKSMPNKGVNVELLGSLSDPEKARTFNEVLKQLELQGKVSPKEATEKMQLVNTLQDIQKEDMPEVMKVKPLTEREQNVYKVLLLNERLLNAKIENTKDEVLKKKYEESKNESQKTRADILGQDFVVTNDYNVQSVDEANDQIKNEIPNAEVGSGNITENQNSTDATTETAPIKDEKITDNAIVKFQNNNPEVKDIPLNTIEENLNIGDTVHGNIMGEKVSGKVKDVGVHKGQIVVDITDQNGNDRFLYSKNIEQIEPKPKELERLTPEQNKRYIELINKESTTSDEISELGELGKIKRGEIPNPSKQIAESTPTNTPAKEASLKLVDKDYELSKDNQVDAEFDIQQGLGFRIGNNNYARQGDAIIRVKNHTPDWSNFNSDLENDPTIKRVINVTVGDYENSDARRNKTSLEQAQKEYPNVEFIDVKIEDGESVNDAIKRVSEIVNQPTPTNSNEPSSKASSRVDAGNSLSIGKHNLELSDFHDNHEQIIKDNPNATITLYHGTINEIKDIKDDRTQGLYFTPSIKEANDYNVAQNDNASGEYGHIYKVEVPLKDLEITNDIDNAKKGSKVYYSPKETYFRIDNPKNYKVERVDDVEVSNKFDNPKAEIDQLPITQEVKANEPIVGKRYYQGIPKTTSFMQGLIDGDGNELVQGSVSDVERYKKEHGIKEESVHYVDLDTSNPNSLINKFLNKGKAVEQPKQKTNFTFEPSTKTNGNPEIIIKDGDNEVGYLRTAKQGDDILQTFQVNVDPKYWKQGAAKEAYIQLAKNNPDKTIRSSGQITPDSKGVWKSLVRDGIAEKIGENKYEIKPEKPRKTFIQEQTGNDEAVTLNGHTEKERQELIAKRVKESTLDEDQSFENDLAKKIIKFNSLKNGRGAGKGGDVGRTLRKQINDLVGELKKKKEVKFTDGSSNSSVFLKVKNKSGTGFRELKILNKDTPRSIAKDGVPLHERPQGFQREFVKLMDLAIPFDFRNTKDNGKFDESQLNSAIADIYDGIPSEQAENVLNHVQKAIETGKIELYERGLDPIAVSLDEAVKEAIHIDGEEEFKKLSNQDIEKIFSDHIGDNPEFYNLIEPTHESATASTPNNQGDVTTATGTPEKTNDSTNQTKGTKETTDSKVQTTGTIVEPNKSKSQKNDLSLQKITQDANDIITGKKVFERFSQDEQRGFAEGGQSHVEATLILARNESASGQDKFTTEAQESSIESYAKENGIWVDNTTKQLTEQYGDPIGAGEEAIVWGNPKDGTVIKTQDTFQYDNLQQRLDDITLHNSYFPEAPLKVIGFGRNESGDFQVIVEQPFVKGEKLTHTEIDDYLEKIGFQKDENGHFSNGNTIIEDVHTGNAIRTPEGNIVVIDPIMRLNTPEQGYGGTRKVINTISDNGKEGNKKAVNDQREEDVLKENQDTGGNKKPPVSNDNFEDVGDENSGKKDLKEMALNIPNSGEIKKYLSGDTIKKYEKDAGGNSVELRNNQEIIALELEAALKHGLDTIEKAKEIFGDEYIEKTIDYIGKENLQPENKALLYVSLENEVAKRVMLEPDNLGLKKLQDLVRTESQAYLRSNSLAINMGRLRKFAETGYDIAKVTDRFFSSKEMEQKSGVEKLVQADAETIQKQYEENKQNETTDTDLEAKVKEGVDAEIAKLYEALPKEKKKAVDKAIAALDKVHEKLRGKAYESTLGIPIAIIDMGVVTIRVALKAGVQAAKAIEMGIDKIKEKYGKEWGNEDQFRKDYLDGLKEQGVLDAQQRRKAEKEYRMLETERNRQLQRVSDLTEKLNTLQKGERPAVTSKEVKPDVPEIEALKQKVKEETQKLNALDAQQRRIDGLETELERLQQRLPKEKSESVKREISNKEQDLKGKIEAEKEIIRKENKENNQLRLSDAKDVVRQRIEKVKTEISNKERELKEKNKPLNEDLELARLREIEKSITELRDKYLPEEKDPYEAEKQRERVKDKLVNDIVVLNEQINVGERNKAADKPNYENDAEISKLKKIRGDKKAVLNEIDPLSVPKEKTTAERKFDAENNLQKRIDAIRDEILNGEREFKKNKNKLQGKKLDQLREQKKSLEALRDKYLPKGKDIYADKKAAKAVEDKLVKENIELNRQIAKGEKDIRDGKKSPESSNIDKLKSERDGRKEILEALDPTPKIYVENALIEQGFGKTIKVKTKNGVEERQVLDWTKLAGSERSIDKISANVAKALEKSGFNEQQLNRMQDAFINEYNEVSANVIQKGLNVLSARNKTTVTADQKSASKKLSELYNYGLFEKDPAKYDVLLAKAIGIDRLSPERFQRAHDLGVALEKMYSTKFNGVKLNDIQLKTAIQQVEEAMRVLLHDESQQHGSTSLKIADIVRTFFDANQRMVLNNLKQTVENPLSGMEQSIISGVDRWLDNSSTPELKKQKRELAKAVYRDMVLYGSVGYGDVNNAFTNRGNLDAYINKMSDNQLFHAVASTVIGKTSLDAVDSMYKSKLTELKFTYNLIKILSKDRLVDGKLVNGMSKEDATRYVSEKLTGQSFEDAKKTARQIISNVNSGDKKIVGDSEEAVTRLANDIVKAALINGNVITSDQVSAAYNSAYKSAGRNLGHVANNFISKGTEAVSAGIEKKINDAIKDKEYKKAALLTYQSIFYRNILNPFVGGGTNWVVLKFEKNGLGLASGLYNGGRTKLDLTTDAGLKNMEKALFEEARDRDAFMRGAIGGATSLLMAALFYGITNDDEYRKWRNKNQWASRYLDLITPEETLAAMAAKNDRLGYYAGTLINKNDAFDKSTKVISAITMLDKEKSKDIKMTTKEKVLGKVGEVVGGVLGTPVPWRAVRDGQNIWLGAKGEQPYKISSQPPKGFFEGLFRGGFIDYIKNNPAKK